MSNNLKKFHEGESRVLIATDIIARGLDISDVSHIINFDISNLPETYVHRIGRTGRAGKEGEAFSFCDPEERAYLKDLEKLTNQKIPVNENHPFALKDYSFIPPAKKENKGKPARRGEQRNFSRPKKSFGHKR